MPSAFFVADCFLQLHRYYLNGKLFRPDRAQGETVLALAGDEGSKAKKCIGSLRYLWRNAKGSSHDRHVQDLKDLLQSSPIQDSNAQRRMDSENEAEDEDAGEAAPADDPQDEASSEAEQPSEEDMEIEDGGSGVEQPSEEDEIKDGGSGSGSGSDGDDASSLNAPTLRLGEQSVSSESEAHGNDHNVAEDENENAFVDSQVRPQGWLGGFYTKWKTAYGLKESDGKAMDDVPSKNPHLFCCKEAMNSEAVAYAMDSVGISMSEEVVRELALGLSDIYNDLLAQDETLAE